MTDKRGAYYRVMQLHDELVKDYKPGDIFTNEVIEYLMLTLFNYGDHRTKRKYFELLEKGQLIIRHPRGRPVSTRRVVTKHKRNAGTLDFHTYTADQYCWSHYTLGTFPLKPRSPQAPLHNITNELDGYLDGSEAEKICVCADTKGFDGTTPLEPVNEDLTDFSTPELEVEEKKEREKLYIYNISARTHISSKYIIFRHAHIFHPINWSNPPIN
jgi:hypothetical protein